MENLKNVEVKNASFESVKTLYSQLKNCTKEQETYSYVPVTYTRERELCNSLFGTEK